MGGKKSIFLIIIICILGGCVKGHEGYDSAGGNLPSNFITIKATSFSPATLTISAGSTITFVNGDNAVHGIRTDDSTTINSNPIAPGFSYVFRKDTAGVFNYHCSQHPSVKGTFILTP